MTVLQESNTLNISKTKCSLLLVVVALTGKLLILNYYMKNICYIVTSHNDTVIVDIDVIKFESYLEKYNKSYDGMEYLSRLRYFKESLKEISKLNSVSGSTVFGLTKFSDISYEEKKRILLPHGLRCSIRLTSCIKDQDYNCSKSGEILNMVDWRKKGVVKPVLDQKRCNGCWAFSVVGVMESMSAIKMKDFTSLSIQELIDCSSYTNRCINGNVVRALDFMCLKHLNITTEEQYPLTLKDEWCQIKNQQIPGRGIRGYCNHCNIDENVILRVLSNHGPVVAVVNGTPLLYYVGGIIQKACVRTENSFDHVIQIVGYDITGDIPYYIVRNSWGTDYGEDGYIRIEIGLNLCGIAEEVAYLDVI